MAIALINGAIFSGEGWLSQQAVMIENHTITAICHQDKLPANIQRIDLHGQRLLPGLIDTQVNGGGGILFNDAPTVASLRTIGAAHRRFGTTGFYPTLISDDLQVVEQAIAAVAQAIAEKVPGVLGIHLEGPFLNAERKGVHNAAKFKTLDQSALRLLTSLKQGKTLVTLAPELTTPDMIAQLVEAGVVVAAGHSAASYEQTRRALAAGLSSFTHLFNAMTPLGSREPGMVGAALQDPHAWCGIIADGHHVHPATLKIAHAAKAKGKMVLVTDAMPSVAMATENKSFLLNGETVLWDSGRLSTSTGTLAGSDLTMLGAVKNTVEKIGIDLEEAIRMASLYPAAMMGMEKSLGQIKPGYNASLILIDADFNLIRSWIDGEENG